MCESLTEILKIFTQKNIRKKCSSNIFLQLSTIFVFHLFKKFYLSNQILCVFCVKKKVVNFFMVQKKRKNKAANFFL